MEGHSGHGGMDMPAASCKMNMLFNWQIEDTCVVFRWWHIKGPISLILSCLAIFIIAALYEWIRAYSLLIESRWHDAELLLSRANTGEEEDDVLIGVQNEAGQRTLVHAYEQHKRLSNKKELIRSSIYAFLVGLSFWLMLEQVLVILFLEMVDY
ncbi:unnamed protein product [Mucor hiemalis]